ncbi:Asp-tRNA(Asn)/Glu-tRNA(Gln) amidotransferase subunit GatC [Candidatus Aerophobetes bacterium]|nr:Asp-tRNA(Asn)/Glu-tRNA(Gln) amidotransferase subunit GatC [Candidatus Aerophobetes bacterium]
MKKEIDLTQVRYIAHLSRLELSPEEEEKFTEQLAKILSYVNKLREVNTENVPPTFHVLPLKNIFRDDKLNLSLSQEEALSNAPKHKYKQFQVPRIIG